MNYIVRIVVEAVFAGVWAFVTLLGFVVPQLAPVYLLAASTAAFNEDILTQALSECISKNNFTA